MPPLACLVIDVCHDTWPSIFVISYIETVGLCLLDIFIKLCSVELPKITTCSLSRLGLPLAMLNCSAEMSSFFVGSI